MKRAIVAVVLGALVLWMVASHVPVPGCHPATLVQRAVERVLVEPPSERETPAELLARSRRNERRILADARDAWTASLVSELECPVDLAPGAEISTAACVLDASGRAVSSAEPWTFELRLRSSDGDELAAAAQVPLSQATRAWQPLSARTEPRTARGARWVLVSRRANPSAALDPSLTGARVAWSVPSLAGARPDRPNVLLLSVDTLRADHLGCYGYARPTSPNVDRLAASGIVFEQAISSAPWTLPSYASLFTALHPLQHRAGVRTECEERFGTDAPASPKSTAETLRPDVPTLAEILRDAGWRTAGFYNNPYLHPVRGVGRGFQEYAYYQHNARQGVDCALAWIESHSRAPWFLFLHLVDPHAPYAPPAPFDTKFRDTGVDDMPGYPPALASLRKDGASAELRQALVDLYDGEIAYADAEIGRLLDRMDALGERDRTIVVFHSDHGEEFWEHGGCDHGHSLYNELLHVPLIVAAPGRLPGKKRVATRVRALDVMPTILELVGLSAPETTRGRSLIPLLRGESTGPRECLSEALLWGDREMKSLMRGTDKLIASGASDDLLFDLVKDPKERSNRFGAEHEVGTALRGVLEKHHNELGRSPVAQSAAATPPGHVDQLHGLGYVEGAEEPASTRDAPPSDLKGTAEPASTRDAPQPEPK